MPARSWRITGILVAAGLALAGCGTQVAALPVPGVPGAGSDSFTVSAEFADIGNLAVNSEVKLDDITVGSVRDVQRDGWHARLTLGLNNSVSAPANVTARIGQKSLLGAEYVALQPPVDQPPSGRLTQGAFIPLSSTSHDASTEQVLSALSLFLNGGGIGQIQTIAHEVNLALGTDPRAARDLITQLNTTVGDLDSQRGRITAAIQATDRLSARLAAGNQTIGTALDQLTPAMNVLAQQRQDLVKMLAALSDLGATGTRVVNDSGGALTSDLRHLQPTLTQLSTVATKLPQSLDVALTFLFPISHFTAMARDYNEEVGFDGTFDLTLHAIDRGLLSGTPLEGKATGAQTALQAVDPLLGPFESGQGPLLGPAFGQTGGGTKTAPGGGRIPNAPKNPDLPPDGLVNGLLDGGN